jgi:hypothetical protein
LSKDAAAPGWHHNFAADAAQTDIMKLRVPPAIRSAPWIESTVFLALILAGAYG